jgi:hypothetical protein
MIEAHQSLERLLKTECARLAEQELLNMLDHEDDAKREQGTKTKKNRKKKKKKNQSNNETHAAALVGDNASSPIAKHASSTHQQLQQQQQQRERSAVERKEKLRRAQETQREDEARWLEANLQQRESTVHAAGADEEKDSGLTTPHLDSKLGTDCHGTHQQQDISSHDAALSAETSYAMDLLHAYSSQQWHSFAAYLRQQSRRSTALQLCAAIRAAFNDAVIVGKGFRYFKWWRLGSSRQQVFRGEWLPARGKPKACAVKKIDVGMLGDESLRELEVLQEMSHVNMLRLYESAEMEAIGDTFCFLALELCQGK